MEKTSMKPAEKSFVRRYHLHRYSRQVILLAWAIVVLFPIYWMVLTSFKDKGEWMTWPPHWVPHDPTLLNYRQIFAFTASGFDETLSRDSGEQAFSIWLSLRDSALISTGSALVSIFLGSFLAYSISRFRVGGAKIRYLILTIRMVPPIVIAIPILMYYAILIPHVTQSLLGLRLKLFDTYLGLSMLYIATTIPFVVWMMLSFIEEVPYTLEHAARIMGAGRIYILRRVVLPLVAPGMVVTFLFIFILNWSEFLLALTITQPEVTTLAVLLSKYQSAVEGRLYGPQAAIGVMITIPVVILGILIQKHLVKGFTFGMIRK